MRYVTRALAVVIVIVTTALTATPAFSQAGEPRFGFALSGGYQPSTTDFDDSFTFDLNRETGTTRTSYPIDAGVFFDVALSERIWRGLAIGLAYSRFEVKGNVSATSSLPHPFFLNQNREVSGEADGMTRTESGVHLSAQYQIPIGSRFYVTVMGGPSFISVNQSVVIDVNYTEEYPYDTATFASVDSSRKSGDEIGFNAGLDVRWMFTRNLGIGALGRVTKATIDLKDTGDRTISVDAGGTQFGAGIRVAF